MIKYKEIKFIDVHDFVQFMKEHFTFNFEMSSLDAWGDGFSQNTILGPYEVVQPDAEYADELLESFYKFIDDLGYDGKLNNPYETNLMADDLLRALLIKGKIEKGTYAIKVWW